MKIIHRFFSITFLVISLLLVQTVGLQAQTKGRNSGLDQTTFEIIKTRTAILEDFKKQRFDRVKVQCDSLRKEFENDNHLPFFPVLRRPGGFHLLRRSGGGSRKERAHALRFLNHALRRP